MKFSELELKRGDTIVLKADLTAVKLTIDITEKLFLTVKDSDGITQISREVAPFTIFTVSSKCYSIIKHQ